MNLKSLFLLTITTISLGSGLTQVNAQALKSASSKTTATLVASCTISAQNLSFGNLVLPLSSQSASTSMSVLCSKNAAYTIGLAYGGVYGTSTTKTTNGVYGFCSAYTPPLPQACYYSTTTGVTYNYGKMIGAVKGDSVGYSIQVPGSPGKVWNTGNYSYSAAGTGTSQTIPVVGSLVPAQSGSSFPTPDSYLDTITTTINF